MPKGVNRVLFAGTPVRASPMKKAKTMAAGGKRKRKPGGTKGLGKALLKLAEQKRFVNVFSGDMYGSLSGTGTWYGPVNILSGILQGTSSSTRIGDEIYVNSIDIKISWVRPVDRPNTVFRCCVIRTDYDGIPSLGAAGAGPPLRSSLGNSNVFCSLDEEKLVIEKEWYANPVDVGTEPCSAAQLGGGEVMDTKYVRVPVNKKIFYKDAVKTMGANVYTICVTSQDRLGGATAIIGRFFMEYSIYYKDV